MIHVHQVQVSHAIIFLKGSFNFAELEAYAEKYTRPGTEAVFNAQCCRMLPVEPEQFLHLRGLLNIFANPRPRLRPGVTEDTAVIFAEFDRVVEDTVCLFVCCLLLFVVCCLLFDVCCLLCVVC